MSLSHSPSIVKDNLQICLDWGNTRCYSGSGTNFNNLVKEGTNNGYLKNNVTFNSANGGYVQTGGANNGQQNNVGDRIDINTSAAGIDRFNKTYNFSISFWNYWISGTGQIFSTGSAGTGTGNSDACIWQMWIDKDMFYIWIQSGSGGNSVSFNNTRVQNTWQLVTVTYAYNENSSGNNIMRAYVNNQHVGTQSIADASHSFVDRSGTTGLQWTLGGGYSGGCFTTNSQNRFGSFYLYNKTLNISEITKNYNATKGRYGL